MSSPRKRLRTPLIIAAITALTLPVVCLWPKSTPVQEHSPSVADCSALEADVERLARRVRNLDSYVRSLGADYRDAAPQQPAEPTAALAAAPISAPSETELEEEPPESSELRFKRELERERSDQQRSLQVSRALAVQLARTSPDTRIESVECTSSMCRCVLHHQTRWAQTSIDSSLEGVDLPTASIEYVYDGSDQGSRTIAYVVL